MSPADLIDDRAAPPVLGTPVGPRYHPGREQHPERLCPWCHAVGEAPCVAARAVELPGSGFVVVPARSER